MDRNEFLKRVREAAIEGRKYPVEIDPAATAELAYVGGGEDPVGAFLREWRGVGGEGERVAEDGDVVAYVRRVIEKCTAKKILLWRHPVLERLGLEEAFRESGIEYWWWDDLEQLTAKERREKAFGADLGITSVDWAIAETGSLAMCSGAGGRGRSVSLLPPVHIAIFEPNQLIPDLFDLYPLLEKLPGGLPSNVTLITGPSKTGDIQLKLTTGVHGPGEVHAVIIE